MVLIVHNYLHHEFSKLRSLQAYLIKTSSTLKFSIFLSTFQHAHTANILKLHFTATLFLCISAFVNFLALLWHKVLDIREPLERSLLDFKELIISKRSKGIVCTIFLILLYTSWIRCYLSFSLLWLVINCLHGSCQQIYSDCTLHQLRHQCCQLAKFWKYHSSSTYSYSFL